MEHKGVTKRQCGKLVVAPFLKTLGLGIATYGKGSRFKMLA